MYYSKGINVDNVKEKLKKEVSDETCQDIEDFLLPKFDTHVHLYGRRKWRIVQDGHGRWREINTDTDIQGSKCNNTVFTNEVFAKSVTPASRKLSFSNHVLNTVTSSSKPDSRSSHRHDSNYKTLSTTTRANIFPGIGKHNWDSQSNMVYTDSALKLGVLGGHDLQDGFYGITKDSLGAWNEASVHHERMKKAWDVYLESLAKTGGEDRSMTEASKNTKLKVQENDVKAQKIKKMKKSVKKHSLKEMSKVMKMDVNESQVNEQQIPPEETTFEQDDDFWDFYAQPFVKS